MSKRTNLSNHIFNMFWSYGDTQKWNLEDRATAYKIYQYFNNMTDDQFIKILRTKQIKKDISKTKA